MIRRIEELTVNSWPALHTLAYDGWLLRLANGYTRRANSVYPLYGSTLDAVQKIAYCERVYREQGQRPVFKLTEAAQPENLDALLGERGYECEAPSSVQVADLMAASLPNNGPTELIEAVSEAWLADYLRVSGVAPRHLEAMRAMLTGMVPAHAFGALRLGGEVVACGLVALDSGWAGLHDIVTDAGHRRQGHGQRLVGDLLAWARARGAHTGWLAVMAGNDPALRLYEKFGFREQYRYWYRVAEIG